MAFGFQKALFLDLCCLPSCRGASENREVEKSGRPWERLQITKSKKLGKLDDLGVFVTIDAWCSLREGEKRLED
jgi:hypothetical protein